VPPVDRDEGDKPAFTRRPRSGAAHGLPLWLWAIPAVAIAAGLLLGAWVGLRGEGLRLGPAPAARPTIAVVAAAPSPAVAAPSPTTASTATVPAGTYTVEAGDTMRSIAQKVYGDPDAWPEIYAANRAAIGPDPDALQAGTQLSIPPRG